MKFSSMLLYVNDNFPTLDTFQNLIAVGSSSYRKGNFLYSVEHQIIDNRFYWLYLQYDNESLYVDKVVDTSDYSEKANPRPKNQVELRHQLFACYDVHNCMLYVSDYQKKNAVTSYIGEQLQVQATVKNVLKSVDEFISVVRYLKSATFTQARSLFTTTVGDSIFKKQANLYGLDLPESAKFKVDYGNSPVGIVRNTLQNWDLKRNQGEFDDVIIVGLDDSGLEHAFNFSTMVTSVEIDIHRDEDYRYNPVIVRSLLLTELGAINGA